jgi:orotidine-5'-phosphate decarboxylase
MPPHLVREAVARYGTTIEAIGWLFTVFNRVVIDIIAPFVPVVKPQMAFYEIYGKYGVEAFEKTVEYAKHMGLLVIADAKRNDGGDTADAYADGYLGEVPFFGDSLEGGMLALGTTRSPINVDCMTVTPYIGEDCVGRFVKRATEFGKGIFVVTKTSFKPNSAVEQLPVYQPHGSGEAEKQTIPTWQEVAKMVGRWGEGTEGACGLRNVGVVMGATYPDDAVKMREILPNAIFLVPGYGSQGAGADEAVVGVRHDGLGAVINNSRALNYAFRNLKDKEHGCPMLCESEKFTDAIGQKAQIDCALLVDACKRANKWSY